MDKSSAQLSKREIRREITRLNRVVHKKPLLLGDGKPRNYYFMEGEEGVLQIRIFQSSFLKDRWQVRLEALKGILAEVSMCEELLEIWQLKSLQGGDTTSWVVFSLPEGKYKLRFRPITSKSVR